MPQKAWNAKRERQYEHIKEGLQEQGRSEDTAEEIAARTVNKERARAGEARESSRLSKEDISSGRRGGLRSHEGPRGRTRDQLYEEAKDLKILGCSGMNKAQLQRAVDRTRGRLTSCPSPEVAITRRCGPPVARTRPGPAGPSGPGADARRTDATPRCRCTTTTTIVGNIARRKRSLTTSTAARRPTGATAERMTRRIHVHRR